MRTVHGPVVMVTALLGCAAVAAPAPAATQTLSYTGAAQTFTVPAGATSVQVSVAGEAGASGAYACGGDTPQGVGLAANGSGGAGGVVTGTFPVTAGDELQ